MTVPHEYKMNVARARKTDLIKTSSRNEKTGWKVKHFPIKVRCKGFFGHIVRRLSLSLGLTYRKVNTTMNDIQNMVGMADH